MTRRVEHRRAPMAPEKESLTPSSSAVTAPLFRRVRTDKACRRISRTLRYPLAVLVFLFVLVTLMNTNHHHHSFLSSSTSHQSIESSTSCSHAGASPAPSNTVVYSSNDTGTASAFDVVVMTYNRAASLARCLRSAADAEYSGSIVDLHVWVDRTARTNAVSEDVLSTARAQQWVHGAKYVHVWDSHAGLFGQWLDTYTNPSPSAQFVLVEDDIELSPLYYIWLRGARVAYGNRFGRSIFGYTLQRGALRARPIHGQGGLRISDDQGAFLYPLVGSWGYAPNNEVWQEFRAWYRCKVVEHGFKPYVEGLLPTAWYKGQEGKGTMWTMWHIKYADVAGVYTVYANLRGRKTLGANYREQGLHFAQKPGAKKKMGNVGRPDYEVLQRGSEGEEAGLFRFPRAVATLRWNGTYVDENGIEQGLRK